VAFFGMRQNAVAMRARERLEMQDDLAVVMSADASNVQQVKLSLINLAYDEDDPRRAMAIEAISRIGGGVKYD
jgi:hypothetical protein